MAYAAGVDVGSTQTKAVILDEERRIVGRSLMMTGANVVRAAQESFDQALAASGLREEEVEYVVGTGYGRYKVTFGNTQVTEISCHGRGAVAHVPGHPHGDRHGRPGHQGDPRRRQRRDRRLLHERQVRRRHRTFSRRCLERARHSPRPARSHRHARRAAGEDQHHLYGIRRIRGALLARQGQEDRGRPARRAPVDRRPVGGPAAAGSASPTR